MGLFEFMTVLVVIGLPAFLIFGLPAILRHRRHIDPTILERLAETTTLRDRLASLEKRCSELERQVRTAHDLLADEQRALDRKLNAILPDADAAPADKTIGMQDENRAAQRS